jgi:hypothetical protein
MIGAGEDAATSSCAARWPGCSRARRSASLMSDYGQEDGQKVELDPGEFRGLSLLDLARESLERRA